MTGSTLSQDVKPLKAPEGPHHDLGQYYMIIDPNVSDGFTDRLARIAEAISEDEGARMPGQGRTESDPVDVPDVVWAQAMELSGLDAS